MVRQYYFDEDFAGAEYRAVIDLVGRKAHFVKQPTGNLLDGGLSILV